MATAASSTLDVVYLDGHRAIPRLCKAAAPPDEAGPQGKVDFFFPFRKGSENTSGMTVLVNLSTQQAMISAPSPPAEAGGDAQLLGADSPANVSAAQTGDVEWVRSCLELAENAKSSAPR